MKNELLRHLLASILYRFDKSVQYGDDPFGSFDLGKGVRNPKDILRHMSEVLSWAAVLAETGEKKKIEMKPLSFMQEQSRFRSAIKECDRVIANREIHTSLSKRLIQGPFADVLTHIGQLTMLSRCYGKPIEKEDFSIASIKTGQL